MPTARHLLRVRGTVQGVGFRPFVFRVASELGLAGEVWNEGGSLCIDAEGDPAALRALRRRIAEHPPARALVESVEVEERPPAGAGAFAIRPSASADVSGVRVSADLATCAACLAEMGDPSDRRHAYPFINCTDCGPRYSIARDVPYDRPHTTMAAFTMCAECAAEYADPRSRRFHAQPNACARCGPRLWIEGRAAAEPIADAVAALREGAIVAVKGLGGFHLACDARDAASLARLRERKRRPHKPFAVMFPDLAGVARELVVGSLEAHALAGPRRPIVLLRRRPASSLPGAVAPGLDEVGAFLPYTPLHHLLVRAFGGPLVMTSGNLSEEPIATGNEEGMARLGGLSDLFLVHDRDIHMGEDDSVVRIVLGRERVVRRARGHVPEAISLPPGGVTTPGLAMGADLKGVFALVAGGAALLSQHLGDLESHATQSFLGAVRENLERLFAVRPEWVAHDLHPGYHSTALALRTGLPAVAVQHHHAHVASCLVDNGRDETVLGVAWDGMGHGTDGAAWGGEFLVAGLQEFRRAGRIRAVPLPGGDAAAREPWRMAVSHLRAAGLGTERLARHPRAVIEGMIRAGVNAGPTTSAGRLFDAVACLAGLRDVSSYEGQAAAELEAVSHPDAEPYEVPVGRREDGELELDPRPLVRQVVEDVDRGAAVAEIGGRFHAGLARALAEACVRLREDTGLRTVALSGGCFHNRLLTVLAVDRLRAAGFEVLLHARVPPGDGGIALGQAAVAVRRLQREHNRACASPSRAG